MFFAPLLFATLAFAVPNLVDSAKRYTVSGSAVCYYECPSNLPGNYQWDLASASSGTCSYSYFGVYSLSCNYDSTGALTSENPSSGDPACSSQLSYTCTTGTTPPSNGFKRSLEPRRLTPGEQAIKDRQFKYSRD